MTDLTSEQKAQVAELLGLNWNPNHPRDCRLCEEKHPITLEALLAYCRERGWMWVISGGGNWNHCVTICAYGKDLAFEAVKGRADPLTAFVRAVLAAAEQEKAG